MAFFNWGNSLYDRAHLKDSVPKADLLLELAGQKYAEAVRIKPDKHMALFNWGKTLYAQAKLKDSAREADKILELAAQKYAEAMRINPDKNESLKTLAREAESEIWRLNLH